jgi:hypothetical protein
MVEPVPLFDLRRTQAALHTRRSSRSRCPFERFSFVHTNAFAGVLVSIFLVRGRDLRRPERAVPKPALEEAA